MKSQKTMGVTQITMTVLPDAVPAPRLSEAGVRKGRKDRLHRWQRFERSEAVERLERFERLV
jgi:hypothetical protein